MEQNEVSGKRTDLFFGIVSAILFFVMIAGLLSLVYATLTPDMLKTRKEKNVSGIIGLSAAKAEEIYPEFICGCCGKPLDPKNICCGMMKNMIDFIDKQTEKNISKDEIVINTIKEFGFNSLAKEETKDLYKKKLAEIAPADAPEIVFDKNSYDFGNISQKDGIVSVLFDFKNDGKKDLVIDKISTSCGCTSASIIYKEKEGPTFTMPGHGKENPKNWSVSIAPNDVAQVKVYYDPNAHGKQKESSMDITRTIDIFSNDPVNFQTQLRIELKQLP